LRQRELRSGRIRVANDGTIRADRWDVAGFGDQQLAERFDADANFPGSAGDTNGELQGGRGPGVAEREHAESLEPRDAEHAKHADAVDPATAGYAPGATAGLSRPDRESLINNVERSG
jgi:hypothetical protein